MVRKYVRKTDRPNWSKQQLEEAVEAVKSNRMSGYEAAKCFQIPRTTINDHVSGRRGQKCNSLCRPTALRAKVEEKFANSSHVTEKNGFGLSHTSEFPEPVASSVEIEAQTQQVPESHQTRLGSPLSQPARSRRRLRLNRPSLNSNSTSILQTRIDHEWEKELEKNRVRAENKMADATLMIAEAVKKIAEASLMNAETNRMNAKTNRMNAETNRKQLEVMKAIMDVQPNSACLRAVRQRTALATGVSETAVRQEGRNADKRQQPPEKRHRARKRYQTDSSSEDSSNDSGEDNEQSNNYHDEEPEIEVGPAAVKIEPSDIEVNKELAQTDPISLNMKTTTW